MIRLLNIAAEPHSGGNRIDLTWENPDPAAYPKIRVMRREGTHPVFPGDGELVVDGENLTSAVDEGLKGERVYYYSFFPYHGDPPEYAIDNHNRAAAMAISSNNMAGQLFELLPGIYHRYDTVLPDEDSGVSDEDKTRGQLRRFLDLPGGQFDLLFSFAKGLLDAHHIDRVDGRLLPLLAQWIGWQLDRSREHDAQRNEVRNASFIYHAIGLIPTVEATVTRVSGWHSRTKEFVHNVFRSNQPERFNLWQRQHSETEGWSEPSELLSLDYAYEGRPATVDEPGTQWLFYHTLRNDRWQIWFKTYSESEGWAPSEPFVDTEEMNRHPVAVRQGDVIWVFWDAYNESDLTWKIHYRKREGGEWSETETFELSGETQPERKQPAALVDDDGAVWLFWLKKVGLRWQLKYSRSENGELWEPDPAVDFPADALGMDPRPLTDLYVFFHPTDPAQPIWVFWSRKEPTGEPNQTRWQIFYRVKEGTDPNNTSDWSEIRELPKGSSDSDDREPAVLLNDDGSIDVFWTSNRSESWCIWQSTLDITTHTWGSVTRITESAYSDRTPLPIIIDDERRLVYRSNESLSYSSEVYRATETVDARYAGSTTFDIRNTAKRSLFEQFEDFQTYTYDTGEAGELSDEDWYARDTIGLYLTPNTNDEALLNRQKEIIKGTLPGFLPIQNRAVLILEHVYNETVYTYDQPEAETQYLIGEEMIDSIIEEVYEGLEDEFTDTEE